MSIMGWFMGTVYIQMKVDRALRFLTTQERAILLSAGSIFIWGVTCLSKIFHERGAMSIILTQLMVYY
jgi:hypothetical protein